MEAAQVRAVSRDGRSAILSTQRDYAKVLILVGSIEVGDELCWDSGARGRVAFYNASRDQLVEARIEWRHPSGYSAPARYPHAA